MNSDFYTLLNKYFLGIATKEEFYELEELIKNNPQARKSYIDYAGMDTEMRSMALEGTEISKPKNKPRAKKSRRFPVGLFTAVAAAAAIFIFLQLKTGVAVIHSSDAEWESSQQTEAGAYLQPGIFELKSGSSTLKFHSGADLSLKAPVKFEIISDMRVKLLQGSASAYVRKSAKGFRIDTPYGYAVDHGTRFSVNVENKSTRIRVSDGEISLHHNSGSELSLTSGHGSVMTRESMNLILGTNGHETTVVEDPSQTGKGGAVNEKILMVKKSGSSFRNNRRAYFAFRLTPGQTIRSTRLTLNYIPTDSGDRKTMPEESEFEIYGIPDGPYETWKRRGMKWGEAPQPENLQLLAAFTISRETQSKTVTIESGELNHFVKQDKNGKLGFVIVCKTPGGTMIHGFSSSKHGEIEGPALDIFYQEK